MEAASVCVCAFVRHSGDETSAGCKLKCWNGCRTAQNAYMKISENQFLITFFNYCFVFEQCFAHLNTSISAPLILSPVFWLRRACHSSILFDWRGQKCTENRIRVKKKPTITRRLNKIESNCQREGKRRKKKKIKLKHSNRTNETHRIYIRVWAHKVCM